MFSPWIERWLKRNRVAAQTPPVVDIHIPASPFVEDMTPMPERVIQSQNQSRRGTTLVLIRGSLENSSGQIGELQDESGSHICYVCEDVSRLPALNHDGSNYDEIEWLCNPDNPEAKKIYGLTAISAGLYKVGVRQDRKRAIDERARYFREGDWHNLGVMELFDVPGFKYIQFHPGNYPKDTHGCFLPGTWDDRSVKVGASRDTYKPFYIKHAPIAQQGSLWLRIVDVG